MIETQFALIKNPNLIFSKTQLIPVSEHFPTLVITFFVKHFVYLNYLMDYSDFFLFLLIPFFV